MVVEGTRNLSRGQNDSQTEGVKEIKNTEVIPIKPQEEASKSSAKTMMLVHE